MRSLSEVLEKKQRIEQLRSFGEHTQMFDYVTLLSPHAIEIGDFCRIDDFVKIEGGIGCRIGNHVHIASFCHIGIGGGETILEDGSAFASGAKVLSGSNDISGASMSAAAPKEQQVIKRKRTVIKTNAFICTNAVVLPGVTVGQHAVLAAGSVATNDIPDFEVWAGVPAKKIGMARK